LLGMCYILCTTSSNVYYVASGMQGFGDNAPKNHFFASGNVSHFCLVFSCHLNFCAHCWEIFRHMVFVDGFLFPIKELGLLTNPGHWVRVLDAAGSYLYIVL
jgi:hypothetical protein